MSGHGVLALLALAVMAIAAIRACGRRLLITLPAGVLIAIIVVVAAIAS